MIKKLLFLIKQTMMIFVVFMSVSNIMYAAYTESDTGVQQGNVVAPNTDPALSAFTPDPDSNISNSAVSAPVSNNDSSDAENKTKKEPPKDGFYNVSDFDIPDGFQLHIKIWKDGYESEEYFLYEEGVGVKLGADTIRYPQVDDLCCIKYGPKGKLRPFSIDLSNYGKGLTDLPNCKVENSDKPLYSKKIILPAATPNFNM